MTHSVKAEWLNEAELRHFEATLKSTKTRTRPTYALALNIIQGNVLINKVFTQMAAGIIFAKTLRTTLAYRHALSAKQNQCNASKSSKPLFFF